MSDAATNVQIAGAKMLKRLLAQLSIQTIQQLQHITTDYSREGMILVLGGDTELKALELALETMSRKVMAN